MRMFFAGAENKSHMRALYDCGVEKVLMSYFYIRRRSIDIDEILDKFPQVVVDSGAFTMMGHGENVKKVTLQQHEDYLYDYLKFLVKYSGRFIWAANYDVDLVIGHNKVVEWNKLFEQLEEEYGQTVCYVAHDYANKFDVTKEYLDRYSYIGASSISDAQHINHTERFYIEATKRKVRTHGFGFTAFVTEQRFPYYTCDSTTYLGGEKYGTTYVYNGAYFETWDYKHKHYRKWLKRQCDEWGLDFNKILKDDSHEITRFNIKSWILNEELFDRRTKNRQWWMKYDEDFFRKIEREKILARKNQR